jgi:NitT/TauT family transport system substrate-binding protein
MRTRAAVCLVAFGIVVADPARAHDVIKIGTLKVTTLGPVYIAQEKGYFAAEGIDAQLINFDAPQAIPAALLSGDIDFAVTGLSAAFYNSAGQGGALKIIAGDVSEKTGFQVTGFAVSNAAAKAGLNSLKDLPGHSLGIPAVGTIGHYDFGLIAEKYGFDVGSVRLVQAGSFPNLASALAGGSIDAAAQGGSALKPALQRGDAQLLAWVADEVQVQTGATIAGAAITNKKDLAERFLRVFRKGTADYRAAFTGPGETRVDGPTAAEVYAILAKYLGQPLDTIKLGVGYIAPDAQLDVKDVLHQIAWYKGQGLVKPEIDGNAIIDQRYVIPAPMP